MIIALVDIVFVFIVASSFVFGLRAGIAALIVIRPLTDRLFELATAPVPVAGLHPTYGIIINIVLILATAFCIPRLWHAAPPKLRGIWLPFLFVCAVSILYSPLPVEAVRRLVIYALYYSIFLFAFVVIKSERDVLFFLKLVILSSILPVSYALFETVSGVDWYAGWRIQSTFSHPNMFAFYLVAVIGTVLFVTSSKRLQITTRLRLLLNSYLIPLIGALIMTQTRSAWAGCFVLFLAYGIACDRRVLFVLLLAAPLALLVPAVTERLMSLTSSNEYIGGPAVVLNSYAWRQLLWQLSFAYIWEHPLLGNGLHSFPFYSAVFFSPTPEGTYAHNDYIQVLFETGLIGLAAFLWIFWRCFAWLFRHRRFDRTGVAIAMAMMTAYLVCSYSDNLLEYLPYQWEFWFAFGVISWQIARHPAPKASLARQGRFANLPRFARSPGFRLNTPYATE